MRSTPHPRPGTLRDAASAADAGRFVGRDLELALADDLLGEGSPSRILFVHGPGGIGKSALLRAIGRRSAARGWDVTVLDPREPVETFESQLDRVSRSPAPRLLVVIDEVDALGLRLGELRDRLLDSLPDTARLVLGGRAGPDPSWRVDGLDAIVQDVLVGPLDERSAHELLERQGVLEPRRAAIVEWAQGSPLALTVASSGPGPAEGLDDAAELETKLTSWLAGHAIVDLPPDLLEVAALAPAVDARLLAAALPARPTRDGMRQLASLPMTEQIGGRLVLHAVLAGAIRTRLDATAPGRKRTLTRRIVEHLGTRARLGEVQALIDLSQFIRDPHLRQALSNEPSPTLYKSRPRPGELATFARAQGFDRGDDWSEIEPWFEQGLEYLLSIRRRDHSPVLVAGFTEASTIPDRGPVTTSLRLATDATGVDAQRSFAGIVLFADADEHERIEASRLGAGALVQRHGVVDMQAVLIHYPEPDRRPLDAISAIAAELPPDYPRAVALSDFGPTGAVGFVEHIVLAELGVDRQDLDAAALLAPDDDPDRQEELRQLLDRVFDGSPDDQRLRTAIELVHLSPRRSEQACLEALHVSRSTWFRLLRRGRERILAGARATPR